MTGLILDREVAALEVSSDRRTVEALLVPWLKPTPVADLINDQVVTYNEQFAPGAFDRAERAPHRVQLTWGHSSSFPDVLGRGTSFRNTDAGEVGVFKLNTQDASRAAELLDGGMGVSARFESLRPRIGLLERPGATVTREQVHLIHIACVDNPAYPDARVTAVREAAEEALEQQRAETEFWETLDRSVRLGVTLQDDLRTWYEQHRPATVDN